MLKKVTTYAKIRNEHKNRKRIYIESFPITWTTICLQVEDVSMAQGISLTNAARR